MVEVLAEPFRLPDTSEEWKCAFTGCVAGFVIGIVIAFLILLR